MTNSGQLCEIYCTSCCNINSTNRRCLDGAVVLRVAFPVARRRRSRLDSQIATAVSQTSPDLKDEKQKSEEAGQNEKIQAWASSFSKGTKFLYVARNFF